MNDPTAVRISTVTQLKTRWLGGLRCRSRVERPADNDDRSSLILETDSNHLADVRGTDIAASSVEHLLHALASSMTATMVEQAQMAGISVQRVVSHSKGTRPSSPDEDAPQAAPLQAIDIAFNVSSNFRASDLESLCANDPMYQTLRRALPINISVEST